MFDVAYLPTNLRIQLCLQDPVNTETKSPIYSNTNVDANAKTLIARVEPFNIKKGVYTQKNSDKLDQIVKACQKKDLTSEQYLEIF